MAIDFALLPTWLTDEKEGMTLATWSLFFATFSLVLTGVGAICFAWRQLEADRRQRRVENLDRIFAEFNGAGVRFFRKQLAATRLNAGDDLTQKDEEAFPKYGIEVLDFCERVAFLTRNGHLDELQVWSNLGNWIGAYNDDLSPHIHRLRAAQKTAYEDFLARQKTS